MSICITCSEPGRHAKVRTISPSGRTTSSRRVRRLRRYKRYSEIGPPSDLSRRLHHSRLSGNPPQHPSLSHMIRLMKDEGRELATYRLVRRTGHLPVGCGGELLARHRLDRPGERLLERLVAPPELVEGKRPVSAERHAGPVVVRVEVLHFVGLLLAHGTQRHVSRPGQMPEHLI